MKKVQTLQKRYKVLALIFVLTGLAIGIISIYIMKEEYRLNEIGDFLSGSVGAFWGIAGLILVYVAFLGQKEQLINQEEELRLSREEQKLIRLEMSGQKEQLILHNKSINNQQFENTFFKLLNYHDEKTEYLLKAVFGIYTGGSFLKPKTTVSESIKEGKKSFPRLLSLFGEYCSEFDPELNTKEKIIIRIREAYSHLINRFKEDMGFREELEIYCRSAFSIFEFIDKSKVDEKQLYASIVINQMSASEKIVLLYMSLLSIQFERYDELVTTYSIFRNSIEHILKTKKNFFWETLICFDAKAFDIPQDVYNELKKTRGLTLGIR